MWNIPFIIWISMFSDPASALQPTPADSAQGSDSAALAHAVDLAASDVGAATPATPSASAIAQPPAANTGVFPLALQPGLLGTADVTVAGRLNANQVVDKVQGFYKNTRHLTANFRQKVTNTTFGRTTTSDGKVYLEKPGKMRWTYAHKNKRTGKVSVNKEFISDGKLLWAVFHNKKEYYRYNLKDHFLPVVVTFLTGEGDLRGDFDAALDTRGKFGSKSDYVVELTPKKPSAQYKTLWLVVDSGNFRVKKSIVLNSKKDLNEFSFYKADTKTDVKDTWFFFNEKKKRDYRLMDDGDSRKKSKKSK